MLKKFLTLVFTVLLLLTSCGGDSQEDQPTTVDGVIGTGILKGNTAVLYAKDLLNSELTDTELILKKPQHKHSLGQQLIVDGYGGILIRVEDVTETADSISYKYSKLGLMDVFEALDIEFNEELTPENIGDSFDTGDDELELKWVNASVTPGNSSGINLQALAANDIDSNSLSGLNLRASAGDLTIQTNQLELSYKGFGAATASGIEINGSSRFNLNPNFSLKFGPNSKPQINFLLSPKLKTTLNLTSKYGGEINFSKAIQPVKFKPIVRVVMVGPVPVPIWITPKIEISAAVKGTAGSSFVTTTTFDASITAGIKHTAENAHQPVGDFTHSTSVSVADVESELGVSATIPRLGASLLLYNTVGPEIGLALEGSIVGKGATEGQPPVEGIKVDADLNFKADANIKFDLMFGKGVNLGGSFTPVAIEIIIGNIYHNDWFFPFNGKGSIEVYDNGSVPDDIFEVAVDGVVLGRTNKGGSGQFRIKDLRPGAHSLQITTIEDDAPPGTWAIALNDGLTFSNGSTRKSGHLSLGSTATFEINVPKESP